VRLGDGVATVVGIGEGDKFWEMVSEEIGGLNALDSSHQIKTPIVTGTRVPSHRSQIRGIRDLKGSGIGRVSPSICV